MKSYIVKQKDLNSRMLSRSGGIFAAISDQVLAQGGVIYGAGMDKNFNVVHKRAVNATERDELRGSKYVQSDMHNAYRLVGSVYRNSMSGGWDKGFVSKRL